MIERLSTHARLNGFRNIVRSSRSPPETWAKFLTKKINRAFWRTISTWTYNPPWGLPNAAKCLQVAARRAIAVLLAFLLLPDCRPVTKACPISPVKNGSSPKFSSTRPHLSSRDRSRTGANMWLIPRPSASPAVMFDTWVTMAGLKDAARPIGEGKIVPLLVNPWRPTIVLEIDVDEDENSYLQTGWGQEYQELYFP